MRGVLRTHTRRHRLGLASQQLGLQACLQAELAVFAFAQPVLRPPVTAALCCALLQ